MMDFASPEDSLRATLAVVRYLHALMQAFEKGAEDLGLRIVERRLLATEDETAAPELVVQGARLLFRLGLRNAMEDFLAVDREAKPVRVDPLLDDPTHAKAKIADIVSGRLEILAVLEQSRDVQEAQARAGELAGRFEWLRAMFVEEA